MTENEAIKDIKRQLLEIDSEDADITLSTESLKMAIQALEKQSMVNEILNELREYSAIGTVEEFKALKEKAEPKKPIDISMVRDCAGCTAWNADCANIIAKAIDEFVIKLKRVRGYGLITNFDRPFGITFNKLDEIAEQLKGGAE